MIIGELSAVSQGKKCSPILYTAQKHFTKFRKCRIIYTKWKNLPVANLLSRYFSQNELQLNQIKHKQLPMPTRFATLTHDDQIKPVYNLVNYETVFPLQEDDCHPI